LVGKYLLRDDGIFGGLICGKVTKAIGQTEEGHLLLVEFEKSHVEVLLESVVRRASVDGGDAQWSR
jgi:hypothetical protein